MDKKDIIKSMLSPIKDLAEEIVGNVLADLDKTDPILNAEIVSQLRLALNVSNDIILGEFCNDLGEKIANDSYELVNLVGFHYTKSDGIEVGICGNELLIKTKRFRFSISFGYEIDHYINLKYDGNELPYKIYSDKDLNNIQPVGVDQVYSMFCDLYNAISYLKNILKK